MNREKVLIHELKGGEVNILDAEEKDVKIGMTGIFLCKEGEIILSIDDVEYHLVRNSLLVYFSYSKLHIISHSDDLRGTLIGTQLDTLQPMLYQVTNFNALFVIKQDPLQILSDTQYETLCQYISLLSKASEKLQNDPNGDAGSKNRPMTEMTKKQVELLSYTLILEILQCYTNVEFDSYAVSRKDEVLQKFVSLLYRKYRSRHEVGYYAEQQFLTSRYFSTIVREKSGKSPSQWIATALLVDAQKMLKDTSLTIKEIADTLCFPNQSYFGKWFKHLMSISPLEYRKGKMAKMKEDANFVDVVQRGLSHIDPENEKNKQK